MKPRAGDERLSEGKSNGPGQSGNKRRNPKRATISPKPFGRSRKASTDVGRALRSVYDSTLAEEVPIDFLDLLGKLD